MVVARGWLPPVVLVLVAITTTWGQEAKEPAAEVPPAKPAAEAPAGQSEPGGDAEAFRRDLAANAFIVPKALDDNVDVFNYGPDEYLVVNKKRRFKSAILLCRMEYNARLATVPNPPLAHFLAEALSETNLMMDALWVSGRKASTTDPWNWIIDNETTPIDPELIANFSKVEDVEAADRLCLAFARLDHDLPQYRSLACNAERAVLCTRPTGSGEGNTTHPGWIQLGKRLYKIFSDMVPYDRAVSRCFQHDPDAQLAVIKNYNYSQLLGRYLLIGRPSLENAWIGARWISGDNQYSFEPEPMQLSNRSIVENGGHWPPWRNNEISKVGGCVLLDRHLSNTTLYVEARCERNRPYICYKFSGNATGNESFHDVIIGDNGYRLHYGKRPWAQARDYCANTYKDYGAYLSEIKVENVKYELLYVMGENRTAVQHIWLGAEYKQGKWFWVRDGSQVEDSKMDWVQNSTFNHDAEYLNLCLDMDRENHIRALHYGTSCASEQFFVCSFTKAKLLELQDFERRHELDRLAE